MFLECNHYGYVTSRKKNGERNGKKTNFIVLTNQE